MNKIKLSAKISIAIGALVLLLIGSVIGAAAYNAAYGENGVIIACVHKEGKVRIVNSVEACKKAETALTWNIQGPAGRDGANGQNGQDGNLILADQMCNNGSFVVGFDSQGNIVCSDGSTGGGGGSGGGGGGGACTTEVFDGIDNDCDGQVDEGFEDADGDGWFAWQDCDDIDPNVNPGMVEIPGDGIDNNCDGIVE